jgi:hypothetical protein
MADCGYRAPPAPHLARPGGEGGIRTREAVTPTRFPIVRTRPDYATSPLAPFRCSGHTLRRRPHIVDRPHPKGQTGRVGFEPTAEQSPAAVFETAPIVHSGTFPPSIIAWAFSASKSIPAIGGFRALLTNSSSSPVQAFSDEKSCCRTESRLCLANRGGEIA